MNYEIDYKLALALKDAGFPQEGKGKKQIYQNKVPCEMASSEVDGGKHEVFYIPTLSELIEACGDGYMTLERSKAGWIANISPKENTIISTYPEHYENLEIAVAKLWLKLNGK